jgi:glutamyl-tRNA reductase
MSTLAVLGLNHRSAPVDLRERLAIGDDQLPTALTSLQELGDEAYVLSTCNRTELYLVGEDPEPRAALVDFLARAEHVPAHEFEPHCYYMTDNDAARHLFRVASGLDSMVLGEDQVLGQVRSAFQASQAAGTVQRSLGRTLPMAIEVGRRVRSETSIGRGSVSPSSVAVTLAQRTLGDLRARSVLVIGAGEAGKATARSLVQAGVERIVVTNRSTQRAEHVTSAVPAVAVPFDELAEALYRADIAIGCTSATEHVVSADELRGVMARRQGGPLLCIDIAVPRDFDPGVADIPGVHLYNIDDLEEASTETRNERAREAAAAEVIVEEAVQEYRSWEKTQEVVPAIGAIYEQAEVIRRAEVERTLRRLASLSAEDRVLIDLMTSSIVRRILHGPVSVLKAGADSDNGAELARLARELFALPADESRSPDAP